MRTFVVAAALCGVLAAARSAVAQGPVPTTVQLPTFRFFTVQTSVSVPDGGGAYLGGMKSARDSSLTRGFGPFRYRGIGSDRGAGGMSVHATIIDLKEMDDAILAEAAARRPGAPAFDPEAARAELLSRHVGKTFASTESAVGLSAPLPGSVAAIRAENAAAAAARAAEAAEYFAKAQIAEGANKPAVAKYYYQLVARRDKGQLQQQSLERIAAIDAAVKAGKKR